jgi:exodeoxyribonuclease V alpha subunit
MARLVEALPPKARLILLGDRDQLASVEAGAVLGDLCSDGEGYSVEMRKQLEAVTGFTLPESAAGSPLANGIAFLYRSWRFRDADDGAPGIGTLARAIRAGDGHRAAALLEAAGAESETEELAFEHIAAERLPAALQSHALPYFREVARSADAASALEALNRFRVLCALREGPFGVHGINRSVRELLGPAAQPRWYHGQPLMITTNDYALGLYNGDVGVVWDTGGGELRAHFPGADGEVRHFAPQRLPAHETVYAMTVHKSQGSEFERVLMILPDEPNPVLTRELVYTGLTRAKAHATIWGRPEILRDAVANRPTRRTSGLADALASASSRKR